MIICINKNIYPVNVWAKYFLSNTEKKTNIFFVCIIILMWKRDAAHKSSQAVVLVTLWVSLWRHKFGMSWVVELTLRVMLYSHFKSKKKLLKIRRKKNKDYNKIELAFFSEKGKYIILMAFPLYIFFVWYKIEDLLYFILMEQLLL